MAAGLSTSLSGHLNKHSGDLDCFSCVVNSFLGCVDKIGIAFEAPTIATGFGAYLAQPILRDAFEKDPSMSLEEARQVITKCLQVLFYRDARSLNKYEIAVITSDGVVIEPATSAQTNWEIAPMVKGYE